MTTHDGSSFFQAGGRPATRDGMGGRSLDDLKDAFARFAEMSQRLDEAQGLIAQISVAMAAGDEERADARIASAAQLPYDEDEGQWMGTLAAHQHLWDTLTDFLESWPSDNASAWVDIVVQHVHTAPGHAQRELRTVIGGIANDYMMASAQAKRLRELGIGSERGYGPQELPDLADRAEHIHQVAALTADLTKALGEQAATLTTAE